MGWRLSRRLPSLGLGSIFGIGAFALLLSAPPGRAAGNPQTLPGDCGGGSVVVERNGTSVFELPRQSGEKFVVDPGEPLTLRFRGVTSPGHAELTVKLPFGQAITRSYPWSVAPPNGEFVINVTTEDYGAFGDLARGAYPLEVTTFAADASLCTVPFQVSLGQGIGGPIGTAAAAATAVGAAGAVAAAGWAASGAHAKLKMNVALQRRRPTGWRRWVPVPSWKRTLAGSLLGTLTGILMTIVFQQGGWEALTSFTVIRNVVAGAFGSFALGLAWTSVWSFVKPPLPEGEVAGPGKGAPPSIANTP